MRPLPLLLVLGAFALASGCLLRDVSGNVGIDCNDTSDCDPDDSLACVSNDPDDPSAGAVCMPPPDGWTCAGKFYKDIDGFCDCGCGIIDVDCAGVALATACDENNCPAGENPVAADNSQCN